MLLLHTETYFSRESIEIFFAAQEKNGKFLAVIFLKKIRIVHVRLLGVLKYSWRSVLLRLLQNSRQRCRRDDFPPHFPVMDIGCKGVWDRGKRKSGVAYLLLLASSSPNGKERSLVAAINRLSPPQISFWLLSRNSYSLPSDFCQAKGRA